MNCDPKELTNAARCFESCIPKGMQSAVQNYLLCNLASLIESGRGLGSTEIPYGSMWADEQSQIVPIAAINTYVQVPGSMSAGLSDRFAFQNARELRCLTGGTYKVDWAMSINCATNNQDLSGSVMVNGIAQLNTTSHHFNGTGASKNSTIGGTGILSLALNDIVSLAVANHTATNAIIMEHANMALNRVGNIFTGGSVIPSGIILIWSGSIASIPTGWAFCDGTQGTPDLRDKFVVAASVDNAGVANTTIGGFPPNLSYNVVVTKTMADGISSSPGGGGVNHWVADAPNPLGSPTDDGINPQATYLPPYYALAYIMKL